MDLTQSGSHQGRPTKDEAEDVVLHTYLLIAEFMQLYTQNQAVKLLEALEEAKLEVKPKSVPKPKPTKPKKT
jgi:hypothetical protein